MARGIAIAPAVRPDCSFKPRLSPARPILYSFLYSPERYKIRIARLNIPPQSAEL